MLILLVEELRRMTAYEIGYSDCFKGNGCEFEESSVEQAEWWEGYLDATDHDCSSAYSGELE